MACAALFVPCNGYASGCDDYPYTSGLNVEDVQGGTKIIATASVGVSFDDTDFINDARDEATIAAKAHIAKFFQEAITSDEVINKAVSETKSMAGDSKQAIRTEVVERVKKLTNSSAVLLRGVVPLGDCYTSGKEMRVSVGLKPETIAAAGRAAQSVGQSIAGQPSTVPGSGGAARPAGTFAPQNAPPASQPLNPIPSYSNSEALKKF